MMRVELQHVGVIVLADHASREGVGADAAAYALHLVRRHHDALPRAAQDDAQPTIARHHTTRRRFAMSGIMRALRRHRTDIDNLEALRSYMRGNGLPERDGGMVAGEDDAVARCHREVVLFPEAIRRYGKTRSTTPLRLAAIMNSGPFARNIRIVKTEILLFYSIA